MRRLVGYHGDAAQAVFSYTRQVEQLIQMSPTAVTLLAPISSRLAIEVDELLDDGSHRITGRNQLSSRPEIRG